MTGGDHLFGGSGDFRPRRRKECQNTRDGGALLDMLQGGTPGVTGAPTGATGTHRRAAAAQRQQQQRREQRQQKGFYQGGRRDRASVGGGFSSKGGLEGHGRYSGNGGYDAQCGRGGGGGGGGGGGELKDLLAQVAPQARITENNSQLATRASARLLGKVLGASSAGTSAAGAGGPESMFGGAGGFGGFGAGAPGGAAGGGLGRSGMESLWGGRLGGGDGSSAPAGAGADEDEDEEGKEFMAKWTGLFSKRSPLTDGTATDPFADEIPNRSKVVWKKDRSGHRRRYQYRRQLRETGDEDKYEGEEDQDYYENDKGDYGDDSGGQGSSPGHARAETSSGRDQNSSGDANVDEDDEDEDGEDEVDEDDEEDEEEEEEEDEDDDGIAVVFDAAKEEAEADLKAKDGGEKEASGEAKVDASEREGRGEATGGKAADSEE